MNLHQTLVLKKHLEKTILDCVKHFENTTDTKVKTIGVVTYLNCKGDHKDIEISLTQEE